MRAVVYGGGAMGSGIAMAFADAGDEVAVLDAAPAMLERARERFSRRYAAALERGTLDAATAAVRLAALRTMETDSDDATTALREAGVVVEAVFEDLALKRTIFERLERACRPDALLGTNTSTLDVDAIFAGRRTPERMIGLHFWNPAHHNRALEIVRGSRTAPQTVAAATALGERLGKVAVVVGNCDGFVANRMLFKYVREMELLAQRGTSVAAIDAAIVAFGFPMGPFAMLDLAGVDVAWRVRSEGRKRGGYSFALGTLVDALYDAGRFGQKSGAGFYAYPRGHEPVPDDFIARLAAAHCARTGTAPREADPGEIVERATAVLANEGAAILDEGIATSAADIDAIWHYGFGYPLERGGGPMAHADRVGLPAVLDAVRRYAREDPAFWQPAPLLERLAASGRSFSGFTSRQEVRA